MLKITRAELNFNDFYNSQGSHDFCDLVITVNENNKSKKYYQAHKVIFAAASPFMKTNLVSGRELPELNMPHKIFEAIMKYVYTGDVVISKNNMKDFFSGLMQLNMIESMSNLTESQTLEVETGTPKIQNNESDDSSKRIVEDRVEPPAKKSNHTSSDCDLATTPSNSVADASRQLPKPIEEIKIEEDICSGEKENTRQRLKSNGRTPTTAQEEETNERMELDCEIKIEMIPDEDIPANPPNTKTPVGRKNNQTEQRKNNQSHLTGEHTNRKSTTNDPVPKVKSSAKGGHGKKESSSPDVSSTRKEEIQSLRKKKSLQKRNQVVKIRLQNAGEQRDLPGEKIGTDSVKKVSSPVTAKLPQGSSHDQGSLKMDSLTDHQIRNLVKRDEVTKKFFCDICKKSLFSKFKTYEHVRAIHVGIKDIPCKHCPKMFPTSSQRNVHMYSSHSKENSLKKLLETSTNRIEIDLEKKSSKCDSV